MAHAEQIRFCRQVKKAHPDYFTEKWVLDVGSLDINGNNRYLFTDCQYTGLDITPGKNVDKVCHVHELGTYGIWDVVICTEMLEHDRHWQKSLKSMCDLCTPGGLILITAAATGRPEHGTVRSHPQDSPATTDYYKAITRGMMEKIYEYANFRSSRIIETKEDIYFYGIKL